MFILFASLVPFLGTKGTIWLGIFLAISGYVCYQIKKKQSFWKRKGIKYVKPRFFLGNMEIIRTKPFPERVVDLYNTYPGERYFGIYQFTMPVLLIRDADLIKHILIKDFDHFINRRRFTTFNSDPFWSRNIFASRDESWRHLRTTLSPSYTGSKMKAMYTMVEECAQQFVDYFKKEKGVIELEMKETTCRYTSDVIAIAGFGLKCNSLEEKNNELYTAGANTVIFGGKRNFKFFLYGISPTVCKLLRYKVISNSVATSFSRIIEDTVRIRKEKNIVRPDMLHLLIEAQKKRQQEESDTIKKEISSESINSQAYIFFLANFDMVSTFLTYAFYELAANPDIQDRLRKEVQSVSGKMTYEALSELKYLDMVAYEVLRKWPPTVITDREVNKDYTIEPKQEGEKALLLEKGTLCWIPIFAVHHDERFYPNPYKFDPERFSEENKHKIHPAVYLPFGGGLRNCIGSRFSLLQGKLLIAYVLKDFEIIPTEKTKIPTVLDKNQINLGADGGMWLGLRRIEEQ